MRPGDEPRGLSALEGRLLIAAFLLLFWGSVLNGLISSGLLRSAVDGLCSMAGGL